MFVWQLGTTRAHKQKTHTHTHTQGRARARAHLRARIHSHTNTHPHTHTHTHTHARTHRAREQRAGSGCQALSPESLRRFITTINSLRLLYLKNVEGLVSFSTHLKDFRFKFARMILFDISRQLLRKLTWNLKRAPCCTTFLFKRHLFWIPC